MQGSHPRLTKSKHNLLIFFCKLKKVEDATLWLHSKVNSFHICQSMFGKNKLITITASKGKWLFKMMFSSCAPKTDIRSIDMFCSVSVSSLRQNYFRKHLSRSPQKDDAEIVVTNHAHPLSACKPLPDNLCKVYVHIYKASRNLIWCFPFAVSLFYQVIK